MYTLGDLVNAAQDEIRQNQNSENLFVSVAELTRYANLMRMEACRRGFLLRDSSTADICQVALPANSTAVAIDPRIIQVNRVVLDSTGDILQKTRLEIMDRLSTPWQNDIGTPEVWMFGMNNGQMTIYPQTPISDQLNLTVTRIPLAPMSSLDDPIEISDRYFDGLLSGLMYRVCKLQDVEFENINPRTLERLAEFEAEFGPKRSARTEEFIINTQIDPLEGHY